MGDLLCPFSSISDRMDVKYCIHDTSRRKPLWDAAGLDVTTLGTVLTVATGRKAKVVADDLYQFLRVSYEGEVTDGELVYGNECSYTTLYRVDTWDLLLSNIGVGRGATTIVPPYHAGKWVSSEYTILRACSEEEAVYFSNLLRTKEILGDILAGTTGMNRGRIKWEAISMVEVPAYGGGNEEIKDLVGEMKGFWSSRAEFMEKKRVHIGAITAELQVDDDSAHERWLAFKPPE